MFVSSIEFIFDGATRYSVTLCSQIQNILFFRENVNAKLPSFLPITPVSTGHFPDRGNSLPLLFADGKETAPRRV
ncbi:MAG: hypothetical protein IKS55_10810 [Oscillospiraceae bacterium]|nr:hypothetical protein [Oscillospiraceae bacterium]